MNRREFTASLGAAAALPFVPARAVAMAPAASPALPSTAYAWAHLIARAQPSVSPAMLARHLRLDGSVARHLFDQLIRDGILKTPTALGTASAVRPLPQATASAGSSDTLHRVARALVKGEEDSLECAPDPSAEESDDARTDQPVQESPQSG